MVMRRLLYFCFIIFIVLACRDSKKDIAQQIAQWDGKTIVFPDAIVYSKFGLQIDENCNRDVQFKILTYVDSIGCTSCKLQLPKWKALIAEMDSVANGDVNVLFFMHPKDRREIEYILKRDQFYYPVCIDEADSLNKLNHFPTDDRFQTFLLDKKNKVLAIGNPVHNPKVKELYMKIIMGDKAPKPKEEIKTRAEAEATLIDLGTFDWKTEQKSIFKLKNTGTNPLIIVDIATSCGCISTAFSKEPVAPGKEAEVTVTYKADHPEHFNKTITVYCNTEDSPVTMKITGTAQ